MLIHMTVFFHDVVRDDIEEQAGSLLAQEFRVNVVPVQQQLNGSDCEVFSIAFFHKPCFMQDPRTIQFDIPKVRPHLSRCLKSARMEPFPTVDLP